MAIFIRPKLEIYTIRIRENRKDKKKPSTWTATAYWSPYPTQVEAVAWAEAATPQDALNCLLNNAEASLNDEG